MAGGQVTNMAVGTLETQGLYSLSRSRGHAWAGTEGTHLARAGALCTLTRWLHHRVPGQNGRDTSWGHRLGKTRPAAPQFSRLTARRRVYHRRSLGKQGR